MEVHALPSWSRDHNGRSNQRPRPSNRFSIRGNPLVLVLTTSLVRQLRAFGQRQALPQQVWTEEAKTQLASHRTAVVAALPNSQTVANAAVSLELIIVVFAPQVYLLWRLSATRALYREHTVRGHVSQPKCSIKLYWSRLIRQVIGANQLDACALHVQLRRLTIWSSIESAMEAASTLAEMDQA